MIRPLRARHRAIFVVLGLALPLLFAGAILGRRPEPVGELPELGGGTTAGFEAERELTWSELDIETRVGANSVQLVAWDARSAADALLYWCPQAPSDTDLPAEARLLGALGAPENAPRELALPPAAREGGWLTVYSLGRSETMGHTALRGDG